MPNKKILLASSSPARKMLMQRLMLPFETASPDIDETPHADEKPENMVLRLAQEKSHVFSKSHPNTLIIGVDLTGVMDGNIIGKPLSHENAVKQLMAMSGKTIRFYIGMCVLDTDSKKEEISLDTFDVTFKTLTQSMIENYLQKEPALNCAGSLQVEGLGIVLLEKLSGDDYTALIGLPLIRLSETLRKFNIDLP